MTATSQDHPDSQALGPAAERSPETLKRAYAEGHTIGTHTWSHAELTGLTDEKIVEEVERTQRAVAAITGQTPAYFRPPYGALSERVTGKLAELGLPAVLWDVDSADWQGPPAAVLVDNAVSPGEDPRMGVGCRDGMVGHGEHG